MAHNAGRHRAPGRFNPLTELSDIAAKAAEPAVKTSAVLAASGGLVAAFAIPAQAAPADKPASSPAAAPVAVKAPAAAGPAAQNAFGVIGFKATAKPKPKPAPAPAPAPAPEPQQQPQPQRTEQAASRSVVRTPLKPATGGILGIAAQYKGIMYKYGGTTPDGFDCSGYTQYVFKQVGISLPRTAEEQRQAVTPVSNPQPGDLVFFGAPASHVGIYAGNGKMWDSPRSGKAVDLRDIWSSDVTYGRP
ncbi:Cell wall-associated hydrolase, NlpC family [Pedococcus cremeus]|uniref:Cell wall-associated hydrolase, NlpC family n=1 Tax=Pedococcus cremeus TaxID=587636 RepID=A0A1H9XH67_9MICO|nr:C40 family peptidase [Pedococcus cremeus]SES45381.1 Cell wall-associated hydrolase, NlpC family [Pedococcus cremeus]